MLILGWSISLQRLLGWAIVRLGSILWLGWIIHWFLGLGLGWLWFSVCLFWWRSIIVGWLGRWPVVVYWFCSSIWLLRRWWGWFLISGLLWSFIGWFSRSRFWYRCWCWFVLSWLLGHIIRSLWWWRLVSWFGWVVFWLLWWCLFLRWGWGWFLISWFLFWSLGFRRGCLIRLFLFFGWWWRSFLVNWLFLLLVVSFGYVRLRRMNHMNRWLVIGSVDQYGQVMMR